MFSVPTQKMPRKLLTSASACKKLARKSELMGINTKALEFEEAQVSHHKICMNYIINFN